jgi:hypothetical protein
VVDATLPDAAVDATSAPVKVPVPDPVDMPYGAPPARRRYV